MRTDRTGFFWNDIPPPKPPKAEKEKRIPPKPVWLDPDYLPNLEEALAFPIHVMTPVELSDAARRKEELIVDIESFPNYFTICFKSLRTGHVFYLEEITGVSKLDTILLRWIMENFLTIGFNSIAYDMPICQLAIAGHCPEDLWDATENIILFNSRGSDELQARKVKALKFDHIDLIEVAPLRASLKTYSGRLHVDKMQDLPFAPGTRLSSYQIAIVRWYCINDLSNTALLWECLSEQISLRYQLSKEYNVDLRSKSDAQIAETIIGQGIIKASGIRPKRPSIEPGTIYHYKVPHFLQYQTPLMNWALNTVRHAQFVVDYNGTIGMPEEIKELKLNINGSIYRMGIGGLHSSEQTIAHYADNYHLLVDKDVTSYYPFIILNQGLAPQHLGPPFLKVYRNIVDRRLQAKRTGNKAIAESLKIVVNGSYGKLGSQWSILYAPDLLIQVTVTGQLALLMLIERLELAGIRVVSANTDGIVIKCPRHLEVLMNSIVSGWERDTNFTTEEGRYLAIFSRDVNNYIGIKQGANLQPDGTKSKGAYANPWSKKGSAEIKLHKNPTTTICVEAVEAYLTTRIPWAVTIRASSDITKFVVVRTVNGGAVKVWADGHTDYLGKTVRWYYGKGEEGELVYAKSGNKVPRSDGAIPLMQLPKEFPNNIDFDWYDTEAERILRDIGALLS